MISSVAASLSTGTVFPASVCSCDGDSITFGAFGTPYTTLAATNSPSGLSFVNLGVNGRSLTTMLSVLSTNVGPQIAAAKAAGKRAIVSVLGGHNDIAGVDVPSALTGAQTYALLQSYVPAVRALGADVVVVWTIPPSTIAGFEAQKNAFNGLLRPNFAPAGPNALGADVLIDIASDPNVGPLSQASISGWYADGTHPQTKGNQVFANWLLSGLLLFSPKRPSVFSISPNSASVSGGAFSYTLSGAGLAGLNEVVVGGLQATSATASNDDTVTGTMTPDPQTATGQPAAPVAAIGPQGAGVLAGAFTWTP